jgi:hypothetical protein
MTDTLTGPPRNGSPPSTSGFRCGSASRWSPASCSAVSCPHLGRALRDGGRRISIPIGLGLLVMMYPVLAKVRYDKVAAVTGDKKLLSPRCC